MIVIGTTLELAGWRQGSIVKATDAALVTNGLGINLDQNELLIVASQCCDIASNRLDVDPTLEFSVAKLVDSLNPMMRFNQNPRILHLELLVQSNTEEAVTQQHIELAGHRKISVEKTLLNGLQPDQTRRISLSEKNAYIQWLGGRYNRPAFPTEFNRRLESEKNKIRKKVKAANSFLLGIYIELSPNTELSADETYSVNLLALTTADFKPSEVGGNCVKDVVDTFVSAMSSKRMNVKAKIAKETEISIATFRRFSKLQYDYISLRENTELPPSIG